jgi:membrane-bound lytic murein transglycosylase C
MKILGIIKNKYVVVFLITIFVPQVLYGQSGFLADDELETNQSVEDKGTNSEFLSDGEHSRTSGKVRAKRNPVGESGDSFFLESQTGSSLIPDDGFIGSVEEKWGGFDKSTQSVWVQYDKDDLNAKSSVDFEQGLVTIETMVEADSEEEAKTLSRDLIERRLDRLMKDDEANPISVISNSLMGLNEQTLAGNGIRGFVDDGGFIIEIIPDRPRIKKRKSTRKRSKKRTKKKSEPKSRKAYKTKSTIKMTPDHLSKRAKMIFPIVKSQCKNWDLDKSLVLSVIHVESYFNPRAISHVGAVGLMQLMPQYGATEAYKDLYGKKWKPDKKFLFNPNNNIKLGCFYLNKLHYEYFKDVKNDFKRRYSSIASYNWGMGNVRRKVLNNKKALKMEDEDFFRYMSGKLPEETRNYISRIRENEKNYRQALSGGRGLL